MGIIIIIVKMSNDTILTLAFLFAFAIVEGKHKLEIRLVRTSPYSNEARASDDESHLVYSLYQMKVHDYTREKCAKSKWKQFLIDSPLSVSYHNYAYYYYYCF